jgi:hypothetical protein
VYVKAGVKRDVYDHSFPSYATGVVIPHGLYDKRYNTAYLTIGTSKDTSEFACDNIEYWWEHAIHLRYPQAKKLILRCDGGGSNSSRSHLMKQDFQQLTNRLKLPIHIQHYPPYCSKYNKIEHRVFPHLTRKWKGVIFTDYDIVVELAEQTTTRTGLSVIVRKNTAEYKTGRQPDPDAIERLSITFHEVLGKWNYSFAPQS